MNRTEQVAVVLRYPAERHAPHRVELPRHADVPPGAIVVDRESEPDEDEEMFRPFE